jgi:hypothetical protein
MFFLLILVAGTAASMGGWAILMALAVLQLGPVQRIGLDDATTLIGVIGACGAAGFTLWTPRCRIGWLRRTSEPHRKSGRILASLFVLFALYWTGYLIERLFNESLHQASPLIFLWALSGAGAIYVLDARSSASN